jgi:hypothetical protein
MPRMQSEGMMPLDAERRRLPGAAFFQFAAAGKRLSTTPYVMAVACWRAERAADAWHHFRRVVDVVGENWPRTQERELPYLPWLAVHPLPYAVVLPPETPMTLGDHERCLSPRH